MPEMILETKTLPEPLYKFIRTDTAKVCEINGILSLMPIENSSTDCPIRGIAADCGFTVDDFLAKKREEKVLEGALLTCDHHEFDLLDGKEPVRFQWIR